ncbi:sulfurtransferase complex subunit TusB [Halomonas huangheensis]|uniref:Sulfur relay protein TusB/DsrH n=1 Tax=Halomonas huangheensis TaxID=1178482 RepID=W1NBQ1_9GAMM|nr:sulfurtransferase complex subunit TusB [Halomonas huangheensis]ALM52527.1 hypothetical protein AR456_09755 [Halomonas huangheensis]ERL52969.1 hypothetical protein BJB45_16950 [Halomonas huangheensis]
MQLHTLNRTPAQSLVYRQVLTAMGADDYLLLIEDAVQGALPQLVGHFEGLRGRLYVQEEDLTARGLLERCDSSVKVVNVDGFVALTEQADKVLSWY